MSVKRARNAPKRMSAMPPSLRLTNAKIERFLVGEDLQR
jgi:hypothetical protein